MFVVAKQTHPHGNGRVARSLAFAFGTTVSDHAQLAVVHGRQDTRQLNVKCSMTRITATPLCGSVQPASAMPDGEL